MKRPNRVSKLTLGVLATICALAVATTASAENPKEVEKKIEDNKLVITSSKKVNDCPWFKKRGPGCIQVKKNKKSKIYFELTNTDCTLSNGTEWELNAVYLGGYNSDDKPETFGFDAISATEYGMVKADFNITDKSSGEVYLIQKSKTKLGINNENQHKYVVWYQVEVICKRTDDQPPYVTTSDPRVRNGGTY